MTTRELEHSRAIRPKRRTAGEWAEVRRGLFLRMAVAYYYAMNGGVRFYLARYHRLRRAHALVNALIFALQFEGRTEY